MLFTFFHFLSYKLFIDFSKSLFKSIIALVSRKLSKEFSSRLTKRKKDGSFKTPCDTAAAIDRVHVGSRKKDQPYYTAFKPERAIELNKIDNQTEIVNQKLMADCIKQSGTETLDEAEAATYILKEIWNRLRETHKLRVAK